jgi:hypothetical protein
MRTLRSDRRASRHAETDMDTVTYVIDIDPASLMFRMATRTAGPDPSLPFPPPICADMGGGNRPGAECRVGRVVNPAVV